MYIDDNADYGEFRPIKSLKNLYEVNEYGTRIKNVRSGKYHAILYDKNGIPWFRVMIDAVPYSMKVARVVAECFLPKSKKVRKHSRIEYKDGDPTNVQCSNLTYSVDYVYRRAHVITVKNDEITKRFTSSEDAAKFISDATGHSVRDVSSKLARKIRSLYGFDLSYRKEIVPRYIADSLDLPFVEE